MSGSDMVDGTCSYTLSCLHCIVTDFLNEGVKVGIFVIFIFLLKLKTSEPGIEPTMYARVRVPSRTYASKFYFSRSTDGTAVRPPSVSTFCLT